MTTKPLYLLIKLDVDGEIVFDYKDAENYAKNFCNNMEFELIDHCLEEKENDDLYIGCDSIKKLASKRYYNSITKDEVWP
tara:strand:+ start:144 stop:383 length:240 start_codon:yes stop_codon:yes gene_type:complete